MLPHRQREIRRTKLPLLTEPNDKGETTDEAIDDWDCLTNHEVSDGLGYPYEPMTDGVQLSPLGYPGEEEDVVVRVALDMELFPGIDYPKSYNWAKHLDDPNVEKAYEFFSERCWITDDYKGYSYWEARLYARRNIPKFGWDDVVLHQHWIEEINIHDHNLASGREGIQDEVAMLASVRFYIKGLPSMEKRDATEKP